MTTGNHDDPITHDPSLVDWEFPPAIATITLDSHGDNLNGVLYISQGAGPHPTVILLHGYPGDEQNLDLAQAIRRSGWNALFFHYRGAWGSGGEFSVDHALEDVEAVYEFLNLPQSQREYRIDARRIALVGHSMGAYLALLSSARLPAIQDIVAITPVNLGRILAGATWERRATIATYLEAMGHGAIKHADGTEHFIRMGDHPDRYDLLEHVADYDGKRLLFVAAARDQDSPASFHCIPLVERIRERNQASVTLTTLDTDHVFSTVRFGLARVIIQWLTAPAG